MPANTGTILDMNFKTIFTQAHSARPLDSMPNKMIAETLLQELEFQIRECQTFARETEKQKNDLSGRPDYTWLMDAPKGYRVPPVVRLELEEMSKHLEIDDVSAIIKEFRDALDVDLAVDKFANYLKFIINHHVHERRKLKHTSIEQYQRLQMAPSYEAPLRSQSSAVIKQIKTNEATRPQSAPLSTSTWKKRSKVHPLHHNNVLSAADTSKSDCVYIDLSGKGANRNGSACEDLTGQNNYTTSFV